MADNLQKKMQTEVEKYKALQKGIYLFLKWLGEMIAEMQ